MVLYNDMAAERVVLPMKVQQSLVKLVGPTSCAEPTLAVAFIRPSFDRVGDLPSVVLPIFLGSRLRRCSLPFSFQTLEELQLLLR